MDDSKNVEGLAILRAVVGFLGEREQSGWWQSSFFAASSPSFLAPIFFKTQMLAQNCGVTQAASIVHDDRIGTGNVYHLFRLPENMEQEIHNVLKETGLCERIKELVTSRDAAIAYLSSRAEASVHERSGPTKVGSFHDLSEPTKWDLIACLYMHAFDRHMEVYPFFSNNS